jgi:hypothetical protein
LKCRADAEAEAQEQVGRKDGKEKESKPGTRPEPFALFLLACVLVWAVSL